jgi:hypothetical protein
MVSYHRPSAINTLLLLLLSLATTEHTSNVPTGTLRASRKTARTSLNSIRSTLSIPTQRALSLNRLSLVILAAPLSTVDTFLGDGITEWLCDSSLADLAADEAVDAVLEVVDLGYACDFGLVEVFYEGRRVRGV